MLFYVFFPIELVCQREAHRLKPLQRRKAGGMLVLLGKQVSAITGFALLVWRASFVEEYQSGEKEKERKKAIK